MNDRRALIARGVFWNSAFQVFVATVNFGAMLVLVRVIPPSEYGRATAATGVLALINCFNCSCFIAQAVQLREGEQPDWQMHWRAGFQIQFALTLGCNLVAGVTWLIPDYRPIAPLLHLASIGLLVDSPNQLSLTMLRREMDFRRMRLISGVSALISTITSVSLGSMGLGAVAIILGANVITGLPFAFHLLFVRRWRPEGSLLAVPDWKRYRPALRFGAQMSATSLLSALRGLLESVVLPRTIGFEAIGLLNRAQVLTSTTIGRVAWLIVDTVYPLLPRSAHEPAQFARHATLVIQALLLISIPGAVFIYIEGPTLSRLLYGTKWIAADPLIPPGTVFGWGAMTTSLFGSILLAANRLRLSLAISVFTVCLCLPAMFVALFQGDAQAYAWSLAGGQGAAAIVGIALSTRLLERGWIRRAILPPLIAAAVGGLALVAVDRLGLDWPIAARVALSSLVFSLGVFSILRICFGESLRTIVVRFPGGERWLLWLGL